MEKKRNILVAFLLKTRTELNNIMRVDILSEYGRDCLERALTNLQGVLHDLCNQGGVEVPPTSRKRNTERL